MSRTGLSIVALVGGGLVTTAVISTFAKSPDIQRSTKPRQLHPTVAPGDSAALVESHRTFALNLYQKLRSADGNLVFSPYSISAALSMALAGARGETAEQMRQSMALTLTNDRLQPAMNAMSLGLMQSIKDDSGKADERAKLSTANGLWVRAGETLLPAYLDCLAENYGAGVGVLDFVRQPDDSSKVINAWVARETEGRIKDLLSPDAVQRSVLILTNAIYFKGFWRDPFLPESTSDAPFHLLDGRTASVPTMHQRETFGYAELGDLQVVELPYKSGGLAMWLLVPKAGKFADVEAKLDAAMLKAAGAALGARPVALALPKFAFTGAMSLTQPLQAMGMAIPFSSRADFARIDGEQGLFISDVIHKAFIQVNEKGTEAAAATAVMMARTAHMPEPVTLTIDRPFIFAIVEREAGEMLFLGRVTDPRGR